MFEPLAGELYDYPSYYDLVYGSDWRAEFDFLGGCFKAFATISVNHVFEPACGTGRLLHRLAAQGLSISGLDLNQHAVDYCNERLERKGFSDRVVQGDMSDFKLPKAVDAGFNMINSFRHLLSEKQAVGHLQCMARAIKPGGLYVLGIHLTPTATDPMESESWSAQRGHLCVTTELRCSDRNLKKRTERFTMICQVYTPTKRQELQDTLLFRTYTAEQFRRLLAKVPQWEIAETFDFQYDLQQPIVVDKSSEDVVYVLRRTA